MATSEMTVSVEAAIHTALRALAQNVMDQHGVAIDAVRIRWIDVNAPLKAHATVSTIVVETTSLAVGDA